MAKVHLREIDELKKENRALKQHIQATEANKLDTENCSLQAEIKDLKKVIKYYKQKIEEVTNALNVLKETKANNQASCVAAEEMDATE